MNNKDPQHYQSEFKWNLSNYSNFMLGNLFDHASLYSRTKLSKEI